jgi:hypothetical protein
MLAGCGKPDDPYQEYDPEVLAYCQTIQSDLADGRFDALETILKESQPADQYFIGGRPKPQKFYESVTGARCNAGLCCYDQGALTQRMAQVDRWLQRSPRLPSVRVSMAKLWEYQAWLGGSAARDSVLQKAEGFLVGIGPDLDPEASVEAIDLARERREARPTIDAIYQSARKYFPRYFTIYSHYANVLMPNLLGGSGELARYANSLSVDPDGDNGPVAYSFVAARLAAQYPYPTFFKKSGLDWTQTKHGFAVREKLYGLSDGDWNEYCYLALEGNDRAAAKIAYAHFGDHVDFLIWGSQEYFFNEVLPWINYTGK